MLEQYHNYMETEVNGSTTGATDGEVTSSKNSVLHKVRHLYKINTCKPLTEGKKFSNI